MKKWNLLIDHEGIERQLNKTKKMTIVLAIA